MVIGVGGSGLSANLSNWRGDRESADVGDMANAEYASEAFAAFSRTDPQINLSSLLENLVIPKLIAESGMLRAPVRHGECTTSVCVPQRPISGSDVDDLAHMSVNENTPSIIGFIEQFLAAGNSVETVYIDLLAPAARKLGEYWENDTEDFVAVTMGLWRIQEVLRELTVRIPPVVQPGNGLRSALFSSMPGEQHSFGTLMVADFFERAGWQADVLIEPTQSDLTRKLAAHHYDLIGLTVSCDCSSGGLSRLVTAIRAVSHNPGVKILVGGRAIHDQPGLACECGSDGTAVDAPSAVALAQQLVPVRSACLEDLA